MILRREIPGFVGMNTQKGVVTEEQTDLSTRSSEEAPGYHYSLIVHLASLDISLLPYVLWLPFLEDHSGSFRLAGLLFLLMNRRYVGKPSNTCA